MDIWILIIRGAALLAATLDVLCTHKSIGETLIFDVELLIQWF